MKLTKRVTSIEDLPPEMINELFEYLPLKDLAAYSLVNKRWHSIYAAFKLHTLVANDFDVHDRYCYVRTKWFHSNQPIQDEEQCSPAMFLRLAEKPLLSNLKQLALFIHMLEFDLNELNRFEQLVHLEIDSLSSVKNVHLNLLRLRVLAIYSLNDNCPLTVDCPQLHTLLYSNGRKGAKMLDVKHPETIRYLSTDLVGAQLAPFKSVESLETWKSPWTSEALLSLPRLRELHYNRNIEAFFLFFSASGRIKFDRMKRKLSEFLVVAKRLKGRDFRFNFCGFQLTNVNLDQIDFGVQVDESDDEEDEDEDNEGGIERLYNEYVYMKNYHLIEPGALHFVHRIDYTRLLSNVTGEFPRCFPQKFTDIEEVQVHSVVEDSDHLLWFLKSQRFLRSLELEDTKLSQEFYDQLPAAARSLTKLYLKGEHCENELQLNFNFISDLSRLSMFKIRRAQTLELAISLVRCLGRFREGTLYVDGTIKCKLVRSQESVYIVKERRSVEWKIYKSGRLQITTKNLDEIIKFLEDFRAALHRIRFVNQIESTGEHFSGSMQIDPDQSEELSEIGKKLRFIR